MNMDYKIVLFQGKKHFDGALATFLQPINHVDSMSSHRDYTLNEASKLNKDRDKARFSLSVQLEALLRGVCHVFHVKSKATIFIIEGK